MKPSFWKTDWFLGVSIALAFLFAARAGLLQGLEHKAYDLGVQASSKSPSDKIAVIAIDEQSIANLGRWPWPRDIHAKMIDTLSAAQAKIVGNTVLFLEPQVDPGLTYVERLLQLYAASALKNVADPALQAEAANLDALLHEAERKLNTDRTLAESIEKAKNVLLAMLLQLGEPQGKPDKPLPDYVRKYSLSNVQGNGEAQPLPTLAAAPPIPSVGGHAAAIGHLNANVDVDGGTRTEPLVLRYYDQYLPSLSVMLAAKSLNLEPKDIQVSLGQGIRLGNLKIATDQALQMYTHFYKDRDGRPAFQVDSFYDVYSGKIPADKYRGKIVLIGATAPGIGAAQVTPISPAMAPVLTLANSVSSILKEDFFVTPAWAFWAETAALLIIALYLVLL
ncbi:MAG: CHASE2 domain-containing protein, partial [Betaproteobacteria bacterium]